MSEYKYTDDHVAKIKTVCANGVTEEKISSLIAEFNFPRRSVTAKLRKLGYDVPTKVDAPVFSKDETDEIREYLTDNDGVYTAEEVAAHLSSAWGREVNSKQVRGKVLSLEMNKALKPTEKKVTPKTYNDAEEAQIRALVEKGAYLEDIATALNRSVNSIRGKLLSMQLKAVQKEKKAAKEDPYSGIDKLLGKTVAEIAAALGKTERGVRTVLTRRHIACKDYPTKSE